MPPKIIILCAGEGSRLKAGIPKTLLHIHEKPLLTHLVNFWSRISKDFIFVVNYKKEMIKTHLLDFTIMADFVEQTELNGIAGAIRLCKDMVEDRFIVVLGDCYFDGEIWLLKNMHNGFMGCIGSDKEIRNGYSVEQNQGIVIDVEEKPRNPVNCYCGMGAYFFDHQVFDFIDMTKPSEKTGQVEITKVIQNMIDASVEVKMVLFKGEYRNINTEEDLK